jgi:rhodanese-related sulfurtransferase
MKTILFIFLFFLIITNDLTSQVPDSLKYLSLLPEEFKAAYLKDDKAVLIDVREFFEYRRSRIKGAVNFPSSGKPESAADTISKERSLYLYCTSGFRSKRVAKSFYDLGFRRLYSLDGGIVAWKKAGLLVEKRRIRK